MAMQIIRVHHDYAGGGEWITWANVVYYDVETREETARCTIAIGCGYINIYSGHIGWDDICGDDRLDPQAGHALIDIEWQWNENGDLEDNFGEQYFAFDVPHEPYNFSSGDLADVSEACEALWHYRKFMILQQP